MEPSTTSLWRIAGEGLALTYRSAPGYEVHISPHSTLVLSSEPVADLNYVIIDKGPDAEARLREYAEVIHVKSLPVIVILTESVAHELAPAASELGLHYVDQIPLMTYRPRTRHAQGSDYQVERIESTEELRSATEIMADAFGIPRASSDRAFGPALIEGPGVDAFVAKRYGKGVSALVTTRAGSSIGIWAMATHPEHQRLGAGRALLDDTIAYHCERGGKLFYLMATEAGKPLYERIGFETVTQGAVWVAGHSAQVPGH